MRAHKYKMAERIDDSKISIQKAKVKITSIFVTFTVEFSSVPGFSSQNSCGRKDY